MRSLLQDIRFAFRTLRRRRVFAVVTIGTLALGIGAATAMYSVLDGVVFRPLPFEQPGRLAAVWVTNPQWRNQPIVSRYWNRNTLSVPEFFAWRGAQSSFTDVGIWTWNKVILAGGEVPEYVGIIQASSSLLPLLGVRPALGRVFAPGEDVINGPPIAMLTYSTWTSRFHGDSGVLGRAITLDGKLYSIIGVLPREIPPGVTDDDAMFWTPAGQDSATALTHKFLAVGRLKPGISIERASAEVDQLLRGSADPSKRGGRAVEWQSDQTRDVRAPLFILFAAVGLLLLTACVNAATLLAGEAATREQEVATRIALGAGHMRLIRQLLTESMILAGASVILAVFLAWGGTRALVALAPPGIPGLAGVSLDIRVLSFSLAIATTTGIVAGLLPALALLRSATASLVHLGVSHSASGRGLLQRSMVAVEVALSVVLLVGAGLLCRTFEKITAVDSGFRVDHLLAVRPALPRPQYRDTLAQREFYRAAVERIGAIPGVLAVAASTSPPFGSANTIGFEIEGRPADLGAPPRQAQWRITTPALFSTLAIRLVAGRTFAETDRSGAPLVIVISESMARRDWPGESALGKQVKYQGAIRTVVGVVKDAKFVKLSMDDQAALYEPLAQRAASLVSYTLLVRTSGDPLAVLPAIRTALHDVAPTVPVVSADLVTDLRTRSFAEERYRTFLIVLFASIAMLLAAAGVYGVTSRAVAARTRELGIRIALGAQGRAVVRLAMSHTLRGVLVGVPVGLAGAVLATRALTPYLFGIAPTDAITYGMVFAFLALVSFTASWVPARRAARVDPVEALRAE
jgi:putative ABC transport system permease protein